MAKLTRRDVEEIAQLARLDLTDDEVEQLQSDLTSILGYMERLNDLDTGEVEPMTHAVPMTLRTRADEAGDALATSAVMAQAPDPEADHFRVPHILATQDDEAGGGS